ncbi:hypothetical protein CkaCkLH20_01654 [Colletotrichum karsti]|uniref:tyrosinase n=1 Tax=Colletotrichum karsti TaxID=1095194 RepID=A0A9P6IDZ3_9PEZI|nr:uncharacterized protein CkaCkLH20_01654 [Colletotrichum karsti]KAF9880612.1 hypothetical protein CkaCkLH20_01654 [Colletotrichum karsti]
MAPQLFWRKFTRNDTLDEDHLADEEFISTHFTDFFGKWLQEGKNAQIQSHDDLVMRFWEDPNSSKPPTYDVQTFMVADGGFFDRKKHPDSTWFSPHARFLTLITLRDKTPFSSLTSAQDWTLCIVGGSRPKEISREWSFLQVVSWNGSEFRFYQSDFANLPGQPQGWNYFGESKDAFGLNAYLGPFNGHVNGACIMKEIHKPWLHWLGGDGGAQFDSSYSEDDKKAFRDVSWLTGSSQQILSLVNTNPSALESAIVRGIDGWFKTRLKLDFFGGSKTLVETPANIQRWACHLFLTTTINLGSATETGDPSQFNGADYFIPRNHFYDEELLKLANLTPLMVEAGGEPISLPQIGFKDADYTQAVAALRLSLLQSIDPTEYKPDITLPWTSLGGDRRGPNPTEDVSFKILAESFEGLVPFNIIQPSIEDALGVQKSQMLKKIPQTNSHNDFDEYVGLFSPSVFSAILMLDFWNPVYSWRRGCLMQYVPLGARFDGKSYSLESQFIEAVKGSTYARNEIEGSPEHEFLQLLSADDKAHQKVMLDYIAAAAKRMEDEPVAALTDWLTLAESRRRIFRPLPLDEFGPSMPFALALDPNQPLFKEMKPDGAIQDMPERGQTFLRDWTTSLAKWDPQIIPKHDGSSASVPVSVQALPPPVTFNVACQRVAITSNTKESMDAPKAKACPFLASRVTENVTYSLMAPHVEKVPNWTDDILPLIATPYWVSGDSRNTGKHWIGSMQEYGNWSLDDYDDVKKKAVGIYQHLRSKTMPITRDPQNFWPDAAIETFRQWANAGFPKDSSASPSPQALIPKPVEPRDSFKVRRDIMSLSKQELAQYQAKLDDVLQVACLGSPWQQLGVLHAYWCLHYQEATFLWHRAYLLYVEKLIDMPIPYWNAYAPETADPKSPFAGLPPMFLEETYVHPVDNSTRPNPLKYALALDGKSKSGTSQFVTRNATLVKGPSDPDWNRKIGLFKNYHAQIQHALSQSTFTSVGTAEGFGMPWANIPTFSDDQPDNLYPWRFDFDGLFEQVHDNYHGWVGPDMADNTYTACDPIFLSYHANMDRLAGMFIDAHPESQYTSGYPLQPFVNNGTDVSYDDPRRWKYTTIGDMAKDTRCLGYMYGAPVCADTFTPASAMERGVFTATANGGRAITLPAAVLKQEGRNSVNGHAKPNGATHKTDSEDGKQPYVVFADVGCTTASYRIDVFAAGAPSLVACAEENPDFIGEITRLGMGPGVERMGPPSDGGRRRCRKPTATRVLSAARVKTRFGERAAVQIVVTDLETGEEVCQSDYEKMPGFVPRVVWLPGEASM